MLRATGITVTLNRCKILQGLDFCAQSGTVTAIVGPNGSGKTTLLRSLTGDQTYQGQVTLNGRNIATLRAWELAEQRAVLPQASALAFPFTAIEVVMIGLRRGGSGDDDHVAMAALARVGLAHYAHRVYQELSGGEQQRIQLARVLAQVWHPLIDGTPRWLFLDEPVSSLDIAHQLKIMEIARDFALAGGGVVAVMHDLNLTAMFADKVTILSEGAVLAEGPPVDVMADDTLSRAYGCALRVGAVPRSDVPFILPHSAHTPGAKP